MKRFVVHAVTSALVVSTFLLLARVGAASVEKQAVVFVSTVQRTELFEILTYPARVVPRINTTVLAETDGIVSRIFAPLGQRVSRKQKLLAITHTDPVYQYAPVHMLAPVAGVVSSVEVTEGTQVTRGQKLASVTDPSQVSVTVEVPAQDLGFLKKGMRAEFRLSGRDTLLALKVRGISPFVDPATGTASCELELLELDGKKAAALSPGVLGQVAFKANTHLGISVPDYAIQYRGTETFARLVEDGKNKSVPVKLGRKERGNVEILSGLAPGANLVLRASRYVAEGEAVKVETSETRKAEGEAK